ncbi:MAG: CARDB domain-containing protein [Planctomycetota bacterium]
MSGNLLPVSITAAPQNVTAGDPLLVADTVRFEGSGNAGPFRSAVYISSDLAWDSSDQLVGFRTINSLAAGSDSASAQTYTLPASLTTGTWFVCLVVDDLNQAGETIETDNVLWASLPLTVTAADLPDLDWVSTSFSPAALSAGDSITLNDTLRNSGTQAAGIHRVGVYLSTDAVIDAGDTLLSIRSLTGLAAGSTDAASGQVTIPSNQPSGAYHVLWMADDLAQVTETDESNNLAQGQSLLVIGGGGGSGAQCELVPDTLDFTPSVQDVGQNILVSETVRNAGQNPAGTFQVSIYLSVDSLLDNGDRLLGFRTVPGLAAGASSSVVNQAFALPSDLTAGNYRLLMVVDPGNLVGETNENNNTLVSTGLLNVTVPPRPDLVGDSIAFTPGSVQVGGAITVTESVRNTGTQAAGAFRVGIYLSPNPVVTPADVLLGSRVVTSLGAGQTSGASVPYTLPANLPAGTWFVGMFVDDLSQVIELSEGNNVTMASGTLNYSTSGNPMANLVMEDLDLSSQTVTHGGSLTITSTVRNEGDEDAPPFLVGIYLSLDANVDTSDIPLVVRSVYTGLPATFTSVQSAPVLVPASIPAGIYTVGAIADKDNTVNESDEDDNLFVALGTLSVNAQLPPAPDLVALTPTGPSGNMSTGTSFTVNAQVMNSGELPAGAFQVGIYLSSDNTIDSSDLLLGTINIAGLTVGSQSQVSTSVSIPAGTAAGTYSLGTWADNLGSVNESGREANNTALVSGTLQVN